MHKKIIIVLSLLSMAACVAQENQKTRVNRVLDVVSPVLPIQGIIKDYLDDHDQLAGDLGPGSVNADCIAFSPDGSKCAFGITYKQSDGKLGETRIYIYHIKNGQFYYFGDLQFHWDAVLQSYIKQDQCLLVGLSFSPDGKKLAIGFAGHGVNIHSCEERDIPQLENERIPVEEINGTLNSLSYSTNGNSLTLCYMHNNQCYKISWDLKNKEITGQAEIVTVSPYARARTFDRRYRASAKNSAIYALAFSADNRYLASCSQNRPIEIFTNQAIELNRLEDGAQVEIESTKLVAVNKKSSTTCTIL